MIQRLHPYSKNIAATQYEPAKQELIITFKPSGISYRYLGVSEEVHNKMIEAPAIGRYFSQNIRGSYQYQKLEPEDQSQ